MTEDGTHGPLDKPKQDNMDKLIVLTIIIVFTVIGNLGVVLAILLRR